MSQIIKNLASGPVPPQIATSYVANSGTAVPSANVLNVLGGPGINTTGSGNTLTINVTNSGFTWTDEATSFNAFPENGYFCTGTLTATLPTSSGLSNGSTVIIYVDTSSTVIIQANTGEFIQVGNMISSSAGTATSTAPGSVLELVFRSSDLTWHTISSQGSWTLE